MAPAVAVGASGSGSASASASVAAVAVGVAGAGRVQRVRCHSRGCGRGVPTPCRIAPGTVGSMRRGGTGIVGGILAWCRCSGRCLSGSRACAVGQWQYSCRGRCVAARRVGRSRVHRVDVWRRPSTRAGVGPRSCRRHGRRLPGARAHRARRCRRSRGSCPAGRGAWRFRSGQFSLAEGARGCHRAGRVAGSCRHVGRPHGQTDRAPQCHAGGLAGMRCTM